MKRLALFLITPLILSGCISVQSEPMVDGGMYISTDNAQTFEHKTAIATVSEQPASFSNHNVEFMTFDPTDTDTMYFTTRESHIYVTQDAGNSWRQLLKNKGIVNKVLINPEEPCHLHAQTRQNVFYSIDCGRSWTTVYLEKVKNRTIRDLVFDPAAYNRLFMTLSDRSIQISEDDGVTWRVWGNREDQGIEEPIQQLHINPQNNQIAYAVTNETFYRSTNQGLTWEDLGEVIVKDFEFKNGKQVTRFIFIPEVEDGFYTVSKYGILKSLDGGVTWEDLTLLPKPKKETILSLAVNPATMDELYYGTARALYYTKDGGVNWQTLKSPSSRRNSELLVHPQNASILYIGVYTPPE